MPDLLVPSTVEKNQVDQFFLARMILNTPQHSRLIFPTPEAFQRTGLAAYTNADVPLGSDEIGDPLLTHADEHVDPGIASVHHQEWTFAWVEAGHDVGDETVFDRI